MPVDESVDVNPDSLLDNIDEIDKKAAKAIKTLDELNKKTGQATGSSSSNIANKELTKQDKKTERKMSKLIEKMRKEEVKNFGKKDGFLSNTLGDVGAKNIFQMGKNPKAFFMGVAKAIPFLGGVLAAKEIADFIVDEIIKIDKFFKKFIDEIDNRVDAFRTLQEQADVQAGLTQRIITTSSGSTEPRYSYNTFEEFNNNQIELETKFQMTNNSGVD